MQEYLTPASVQSSPRPSSTGEGVFLYDNVLFLKRLPVL